MRGANPSAAPGEVVRRVVRWYFDEVYGRYEGGSVLPYYVDPKRVGHFAVDPDELRDGTDAALFRLFVAMAMFQARRDVLIMEQQRRATAREVSRVATMTTVRRCVSRSTCPRLKDPASFHDGCDVRKSAGVTDCTTRPAEPCHVKEATRTFRRMGDFGMLPTSAWLLVWRGSGLRRLVREVARAEPEPTARAAVLVDELARVHRVGRKLATMFVSALSTPALATGLTPWHPDVDGNELVVVDTNVARAVITLAPRCAHTYVARDQWVREQARRLGLQRFGSGLPHYSPRLVQQALYAFCSRSNRLARGDACARRGAACATCVTGLCPFATGDDHHLNQ